MQVHTSFYTPRAPGLPTNKAPGRAFAARAWQHTLLHFPLPTCQAACPGPAAAAGTLPAPRPAQAARPRQLPHPWGSGRRLPYLQASGRRLPYLQAPGRRLPYLQAAGWLLLEALQGLETAGAWALQGLLPLRALRARGGKERGGEGSPGTGQASGHPCRTGESRQTRTRRSSSSAHGLRRACAQETPYRPAGRVSASSERMCAHALLSASLRAHTHTHIHTRKRAHSVGLAHHDLAQGLLQPLAYRLQAKDLKPCP